MDRLSLLGSSLGLIGFVAACFIVATFGATFPPGEWYESLAKPEWRPPNWLFGPVWTALYLMIAVAGWLIWREAGFSGARTALTLYAVQLALNAAWSPVFFGLHRMDLAFGVIVLLWAAILATILAFRPIRRLAALLLAPYLAWVSFASALNFAIWRMNG